MATNNILENPVCSCGSYLWFSFQAAKIPLSSELGIDEFHFNDFSLDNDGMITASLRMFLELGVGQKFKIDYEVREPLILDKYTNFLNKYNKINE